MDFGLSQDQVMLKDTVKRFLAEKCPTTRVREIMESENGYDDALHAGLVEIGAYSVIVPADYDGLGLELLDLLLIAEEMGYAAAPGPFFGTSLASLALVEGGNDALKKAWLPKLSVGEAIGTVAIGEAESQWDPSAMKASVRDGRLTGEKPLVPHANLAQFMVVAANDDNGPGLWLVETAAPGVTVAPLKGNDMTRRLFAVEFKDAPATPLPNRAALQRTIDAGLILLAADCYGGSHRCVEMSATYALQREQFGQPIGAFQAVKHQLANMACDLETSLSLCWYAAHAFDHIKDRSERHAAITKAYLSDIYDRVVRDSTELHGGIGFTWEFDLHLWFRRSMYNRGYFGDANYLRNRAADLAGW